MYLANDVIQNSKKKGPEYGKEFSNVLPKVFAHIGETCKSDKLLGSLGRILNIWQERGVYDPKTIADYRGRLHKDSSAAAAGTAAGNGNGTTKTLTDKHSKVDKSEKREKRKHEERLSKSKEHAHLIIPQLQLLLGSNLLQLQRRKMDTRHHICHWVNHPSPRS